MASEVDQWRLEGQQRIMQRDSEEQRLARLEAVANEEKYRFKPWDPFGRPGGGAPLNDSNKRRRGWGYASTGFDVAPNAPKPEVPVTNSFNDHMAAFWGRKDPSPSRAEVYQSPRQNFYDHFGAPGGGAPMRSDNGEVFAGKVQHDDLVMQANIVGRKTFLNAIPPVRRDTNRAQEYKKALDDQYFQQVAKLQAEKQRELELEQKTVPTLEFNEDRSRNEDPLRGHMKPKPHLAPEEFDNYNPWGKGQGTPMRDAEGYVKRHKNFQMTNGLVQLPGMGEESGEYEKEVERVQAKKERQVHIFYDQMGQPIYDVAADEKFEPYDPFGKPGAGAPRRDEYGNIMTKMPPFEVPDPIQEKQKNWSNKVYLTQIKEAMKEHQMVKGEWNAYDKASCATFADIVDNAQVGKVLRNPTTGFIEGKKLVSTEITRPARADVIPPIDFPYQQKYCDDLKKQMEDRERRGVLDTIRERQEANQHYVTANHYWGHRGRGIGAPPPKLKPPVIKEKHYIGDEYSTNIYDALYMHDYPPPRPLNVHNASEAHVTRLNENDTSPSQPAYATDSLYVPGGGLGYYGQNLLPQNDGGVGETGSQLLHDKALLAAAPFPIHANAVHPPAPKPVMEAAGKPSHPAPRTNHPGPKPGESPRVVPTTQLPPASTKK